jgi:REP element-mobilizing transposase RayT
VSTGFQIDNQNGVYFLTFQVVDWVDIFTRKIYRDIILESFTFCRKHKGLKLWAYVVMSNHVHCIISAKEENLSDIVRDFKAHTAKKIIKAVQEINESRRDWLLKRFEFAAKSNLRSGTFQFWTHENHAVEIISNHFLRQKLAYIHENPVRAGLVEKPSDWLYSSQRNYMNLEVLIEIDVSDF